MPITSLFDTENPASGFRLTSLEIFNWGTFDGKIRRIQPDGKTSLLTGGNGSGKTTLADAVITLLVPPLKRYYNQSSGTDRKKDRTEKTYMLGAYKILKGESELTAKTQYLRTKDDFSILLAVFFNKDAGESVTLAQVRWFTNNNLQRSFIVAPQALGIKEYFYPMDTGGKWKKRLKEECRAEFYDNFAGYSRRFMKDFGLRSDKALSLFSQTVGIKDIENLNRFIRSHMLEEIDVEDHFRKLKENYDNLLLSHNAIEKARVQLDLLEPVKEKGHAFEAVSQKVIELEQWKDVLPYHFAVTENRLLAEAVTRTEKDAGRFREEIQTANQELRRLEDDKDALVVAIGNNSAAGEIRLIETKISHCMQEKDTRQKQAQQYAGLARILGFPDAPDEMTFRETAGRVKDRLVEIENRKEEVIRDGETRFSELSQVRHELQILTEELTFLRSHEGNIPLPYQKTRQLLADHLGVDPDQIPFAGELIAVHPRESVWARSIEAVLHDFGLSLLVTEDRYERVVAFLDQTDSDHRIVFWKVTLKNAPQLFDAVHQDSLVNKIAVKPETRFSAWLGNYLAAHFQYVLTRDLTDFRRQDKAATGQGLTHDRIRHEKDDCRGDTPSGKYILGWDNREKINYLAAKAKGLDDRIRILNREIADGKKRIKALEEESGALIKIAGFDQYQDINVRPLVLEIDGLQARREKLLTESDKLRELENQLTDIKQRIVQSQTRKEKAIAASSLIEERLRQYNERIRKNAGLIRNPDDEAVIRKLSGLQPYLEDAGPMDLDFLAEAKEKVTSRLDRHLRNALANRGTLQTELVRRMHEFKNPEEEIRGKFPDWTVETANLKADTDYLAEYLAIRERIVKEDLPAYKRRFKKYLNEQVIFDIANFKTTLDNQVNEIKKSIRQINGSLAEIQYSSHPPTYIQISDSPENDIRIREFVQMVNAAIPDAVKVQRGDEQELEFAFTGIKKVIDLLAEDVDRRRYVTDVRNWLKFAAVEKFKADDVQVHFYEDSQSLSGGEKAKLAYTILASALAYQFGINRKRFHIRSFRFVMVDEAFSKVDPENSIYAMELFKRLNLQVMLITPLDKINLAEKFIHSVHYVENRHQRDSAVYDLTMEEYHREKDKR